MDATTFCPECGDPIIPAQACQERFEQFLAWEFEDMARPGAILGSRLGTVHHLMVLCFHLQHPSRYSPDGLNHAMQLLLAFAERGETPQQVRLQNRDVVNSSRRDWKITGTPQSHGAYANPPRWHITAASVLAVGPAGYVEAVNAWARAILEDLRKSGNL